MNRPSCDKDMFGSVIGPPHRTLSNSVTQLEAGFGLVGGVGLFATWHYCGDFPAVMDGENW